MTQILVTTRLAVTNGSFSHPDNSQQFSVVQSNVGGGSPGTVKIGTTEEVIDFGDIATPGWCKVTNLDETNFVEFGPESAGALVPYHRVKPGTSHVLELSPGVVVRGKADTAEVSVVFAAMEV